MFDFKKEDGSINFLAVINRIIAIIKAAFSIIGSL